MTTTMISSTLKVKAPHKPYNILNKKIGHVSVIRYMGTHNKMKRYLVRCECGNLHETYGKTLITAGENNSDYRCDKCRLDPLRLSKMEFIRFIDSKAWSSWQYMVKVCYPRKGNVNRSMNKDWFDFFFLKDMGEPNQDQSLFHIKQFGEYNKKTCKWADKNHTLLNYHYI